MVEMAEFAVLIDEFNEKKMEVRFRAFLHGKRIMREGALFSGRLKIYLKREELFRPRRLLIERGGRVEYRPPEDFVEIVRSARRVFISKSIEEEIRERIFEMLTALGVRKSKILEVVVCPFCSIEGKITLLSDNEAFEVYDKLVCLECAKEELLEELKYRGLRLSEDIVSRLVHMLRRVRSVEKLLNYIITGISIYSNPDLTLFDRIEPEKIEVPPLSIDELDIPEVVKDALKRDGIRDLMPIQVIALRNGLLSGANLLVVSATSTGKTLIGELPGIVKALNGMKMIYLCNLVALANQKYETFKARYSPLGLKFAIRVGMNRIDVENEELVVADEDVRGADVIVGTYEGIDYLIRSGQHRDLEKVGVVVIDEIQTLSDRDRGAELDGLIARIRTLFPNAQIIALSASVGNPEELAEELNLKLVKYEERPVPLERHLVICLSERDKLRATEEIIKSEWNVKSSYGFRGQTIVFTNSRRRAHEIARWLQSRGVLAAVYHAGLAYPRRKAVELAFERGAFQAVVTTYALGAGFDAPASAVVFESLAQGRDFITKSMFENMAGRAGRLGKHDRGKVVLLVEPGKKYGGEVEETEDSVAMKLLTGELEPVRVEYGIEECADQVLAYISAKGSVTMEELDRYYGMLLGAVEEIDAVLEELRKRGLIVMSDSRVEVTPLGRAVAMSFFKPSDLDRVLDLLSKGVDPLTIAITLEPFTQVYILPRIQREIERIFNIRVSSRLFSDAVLEAMDVSGIRGEIEIPKWLLDVLSKWAKEFFNCDCKERPFCEHGIINLCRKIIDLRVEGRKRLSAICGFMRKEYSLHIYEGDLFRWFDALLHRLRGVGRIASVISRNDVVSVTEMLIRKIENPSAS